MIETALPAHLKRDPSPCVASSFPSCSLLRCPSRPRSQQAASFPQPTPAPVPQARSEEHTSELQSLMRISYAVFCLKKKKKKNPTQHTTRLQPTADTT